MPCAMEALSLKHWTAREGLYQLFIPQFTLLPGGRCLHGHPTYALLSPHTVPTPSSLGNCPHWPRTHCYTASSPSIPTPLCFPHCHNTVWASQVALLVKNLPANAGDAGLIPGSGRSPGGGTSNPLQYSCPENSTDRGAWWAAVHGVTRSRTRLSDWACTHTTLRLKEGRWGQNTKAEGKHCHSRTQAVPRVRLLASRRRQLQYQPPAAPASSSLLRHRPPAHYWVFCAHPPGLCILLWAVALSPWGLSENLYTKS